MSQKPNETFTLNPNFFVKIYTDINFQISKKN